MEDRVWRNAEQSYLRPLPARLGVSSGGRSRRLDRVLTAFGCEHSFAQAAGSVLEHYGFEISASAVRVATLKHAQRARQQLETEYGKTFRELPVIGSEHVITQADGTMICRWIMPYQKIATLRLHNLARIPVTVAVNSVVSPWEWTKDSWYFQTNWWTNEPYPPRPVFDMNFIDVTGRGMHVGATLVVLNPL